MKEYKLCFLALSLLVISKKSYTTNTNYADSLKTEIKNASIDSVKFNLMDTLITFYDKKYMYDSSLAISLIQKQFVERNYPKGINKSLDNLSATHEMKGMYSESLFFLKKHLKLEKKEGNQFKINYVMMRMGSIYGKQSENLKAINCFLLTLNKAEEIGDTINMHKALSNISVIYELMDMPTKANKYLSKALRIAKKLKKNNLIAPNLANLGSSYLNLKKYDLALKAYLESLDLYRIENYRNKEAILLNNIAFLYFEKKEYKLAQSYAQKAIQTCIETNNKRDLSIGYSRIGKILSAQNKSIDAIRFLKKGLSFALKSNGKSQLLLSYKDLYETFAKLAQFDSAYVYLQLYHQTKDSLFTLENNKMVAEVTNKYETEKKDQEILLLSKDKELQAERLEKIQRTQNGLIVGIILFVILIIFLIVRYREKQKAKQLILTKDREVKKQHNLIIGREVERKRIAKDLHDGVGGTIAAIKMNLESINKSVNNKKIERVLDNIDSAYNEVRNISHNLTPIILKDKEFTLAIEEYLEKFKVKIKIHLDCFGKDRLNKLPQNVQSDIYRIVQELVNNVIKHAQASKMDVSLSIENGNIDLMVEDNGVGFNTNAQKKGIGLNNINSRVQLLGAKLFIDSQKNKGSSFHIQFSVKQESPEALVA